MAEKQKEKQEPKDPSFSTLNLPFLQLPAAAAASPEHPSTPPFQASASVPFKWEEQPGKPRPCSAASARPEPAKSLELPPCMSSDRFTKTPSPTTVLDGPYNVGRPKFSSFRFFRDGFDGGASPEGTGSEALLGGKKGGGGAKAKGLFGKFKGGKRVLDGGSCRFSPSSVSSCDSEERFNGVKSNCGVKMTRNGSFSTTKSSHLWSSIYQGIKQVVQWKSGKKSNKGQASRRKDQATKLGNSPISIVNF